MKTEPGYCTREKLYQSQYDSPLGKLIMVSDGIALKRLYFEDQDKGVEGTGEYREGKNIPVLEQTIKWLDLYFAGSIPDFLPALSPDGTEFRKNVWKMILKISYGEVSTYGEIAVRLSQAGRRTKACARAVGGAAGHNPILILIPCHRVLGKGGRLSGYSAGPDRKRFLLQLENRYFLKSGN